MDAHKKLYSLYRQTGALLVVLIILTGSLAYVLFGSQTTSPSDSPTTNISNTILPPPFIKSDSQLTTEIAGSGECNVTDYSISPEEQQLIDLINNYRAQNGLNTLTPTANLSRMASWTAEDMPNISIQNILDHIDSLGRNPQMRAPSCGASTWDAETLNGGQTSVQQSFDTWRTSPGHNAILLKTGITTIGVSKYTQPGSYYVNYWVAEFGKGNDGSGSPPTNQPPSATCLAGSATSASTCNGWNIAPGQDFYQYPSAYDSTPSPNGAECKFACDADINCRAYTWVPAGQSGSYNGQNTCYLKNVTEPRSLVAGLVSGFKSSGTGGGIPTATPTQIIPTATKTPTPTATKTPTPSPTATTTPTLTSTPTITASPTATPPLSQTTAYFEVLLQGIGPDTQKGFNPNPIRTTRVLEYQILNSQQIIVKAGTLNVTAKTGIDLITYNGQTQLGIKLNTQESYIGRFRLDNTLWRKMPSNFVGELLNVHAKELILGDLDQNNQLDLADYNNLLSCYGTRTCTNKTKADLNDDGLVDEKDLNIFYSSLATRQGD